MRLLPVAVLVAVMLSGCSSLAADPGFVGVSSEMIECADGQASCLRVFSEVGGSSDGTGSCILYATTGPQARVAVAASGDLDLVPGSTVEWIVRVPSHLGDWDPVCVPTAEG